MPALQSITAIDWTPLLDRPFTTSPQSWSDQVMYFILIDRFSDGLEQSETLFSSDQFDSANLSTTEAEHWREAGYTFCGGTLRGVQSKLEYLKRLGITTIWLSPVLQQPVYDSTSYHGYGSQNFLMVDARFGTQEDLQSLVDEAHQRNMYVVLDIVVNHAGFVFEYDVLVNSETEPSFNKNGKHPVSTFHDADGKSTIPFGPVDIHQSPNVWPFGAIWPSELQNAEAFNRRGCISNWENPDEYLHGDFKFLKDIHMGVGEDENFQPSEALITLIKVYQYWLAFADLDGFRLDAVKHMGIDATKYFSQQIQQFAQKIGKHNFYIFGEIPGGEQQARDTMDQAGLNAVLALLDIPASLEAMIKGEGKPQDYFKHFATSALIGNENSSEVTWKKDEIVLFLDDHDQIRKNFDKARFPAGSVDWQKLAFPALATLVCSSGIPCIYYGSEQGFDGQGRHDRYIRETMFASEFGAFRSKHRHFFNEELEIYQNLQRLLAIRSEVPALRQGTQQLLEISGDGEHFGLPTKLGDRMFTVIPWLRQTGNQSIICVVSTDPNNSQTTWIRLLAESTSPHKPLRCLFSTDPTQVRSIYPFEKSGEYQIVRLSLVPAGFALFQM